MDPISYQKAKKAQKEIKRVQDKLGLYGTEQGLDVRDVYDTVSERITAIEEKDPEVALLIRVSDLSKHTTINLNKYNLKIAGLLNLSKYRMLDMIVDDFSDDSGIDYDKSSNIVYDNQSKTVKMLDPAAQAELHTVSESFESISNFIFTSSIYIDTNKEKKISLESGEYIDTEYSNSALKILKDDIAGYMFIGEFISDPVVLEENTVKIKELEENIDLPEDTSYEILFSTSEDNISYSEFKEGLPLPEKYVKIKVILHAKLDVSNKNIIPQQQDNNSVFKNNRFQLRMLGESSFYIRNLHQYTPLEFTSNVKEKKHSRRYEIKRIINKGWNR